MLGLVTLATTMTGLRRSDVTGTTIVTSVAAEMIDMSVAAENACRSTSIGTTTTDEGGEVAAARARARRRDASENVERVST